MSKPKTPNYHRQRFLLVLLELVGGYLSKTDFQKLLFLSQQEIECSYYDFVPYHYGCYSFQAQSDIEMLESKGWLQTVGAEIQLLEKSVDCMARDELARVSYFARKYKNYRGIQLVRFVYEHYPYYAIHSKIAKDLLDNHFYQAVIHAQEKLKSDENGLFTIGYEGLSFEKYINELISHDVHLLCDVRNNPLSRKFGFSKGVLSQLLPKFGIEYIHIPELGIVSENRNNLETKSDYVKLFKSYRNSLPQKEESLKRLSGLLDKHKRVALTCFEKQHDLCHRHCISEYLENIRNIKVIHL
ncbi:DUF488 family protein [Nitrosomonas sp. Nm33]|uniref:DUF488 domain-containing protein n=1 Tax=Nitrosomonas sp. Nm33 TaxID=133724 RepID=UPI00089D2A0C|nr:DUF488 domain-containing protein [Nitrosomonas sp. Nm33]SDY62178.1 Uncharacterized conserved protein, DUF488 family [Nitrosomonas sp. Nm33]